MESVSLVIIILVMVFLLCLFSLVAPSMALPLSMVVLCSLSFNPLLGAVSCLSLSADSVTFPCVLLSWWTAVAALLMVSTSPSTLLQSLVPLVSLTTHMAFSSLLMVWFYVWFEMSLIPMGLMILGFGFYPERLAAASFMAMYTVGLSFPLMVSILSMGSPSWSVFSSSVLSSTVSTFILLAFLVKIPIFGLHLWLPKAHVQAPTQGSLLLASVMLKLGTIGVYRVASALSGSVVLFLVCLVLWGGVQSALQLLCQVDLKAMVAYSSVVHMAIPSALLVAGSQGSLTPIVLMLVGHGLVSSGLFYFVGSLYSSFSSRSILLLSGIGGVSPSHACCWAALVLSNVAVPPSMSFFGEVYSASCLMGLGWALVCVLGMLMSLSLGFCVLMLGSGMGSSSLEMSPIKSGSPSDNGQGFFYTAWLILCPMMLLVGGLPYF